MMMSGWKSRISCTCFLGLAARHRDHRAAQALGAVVRAEAAGEQAIAVGNVHLVALAPPAARIERATVGPGVDVVLRVADHGRLAGGAAGGMQAHHLVSAAANMP
jgi:hypothetical protein